MSEFISNAVEVVALIGLMSLVAAVSVAIARVVAADGYGHSNAPRGADDWSAHGLPSHPYGC